MSEGISYKQILNEDDKFHSVAKTRVAKKLPLSARLSKEVSERKESYLHKHIANLPKKEEKEKTSEKRVLRTTREKHFGKTEQEMKDYQRKHHRAYSE